MQGQNLYAYRRLPADIRETKEHAHQTCLLAETAVEKAAALIQASLSLRTERDHWRRVWKEIEESDPDYLAVCCSYCNRVRSQDGTWGAIPSGIRQVIHGTSAMKLTHGICADCQPSYFPPEVCSIVIPAEPLPEATCHPR